VCRRGHGCRLESGQGAGCLDSYLWLESGQGAGCLDSYLWLESGQGAGCLENACVCVCVCVCCCRLLVAESKADASQFLLLSTVGHFSLLPLIFTSAGTQSTPRMDKVSFLCVFMFGGLTLPSPSP